MEHWLPLFEERLATLFDHLGADDVIVIDSGALGARLRNGLATSPITTPRASQSAGQAAGSYRPLATDALYLSREEFDGQLASWPGPPR